MFTTNLLECWFLKFVACDIDLRIVFHDIYYNTSVEKLLAFN